MGENTYQHKASCEDGCDDYIKTDCIVYEEAIEYLGLEAGANTTEIISKLVQALEYMQQQINTHHPSV